MDIDIDLNGKMFLKNHHYFDIECRFKRNRIGRLKCIIKNPVRFIVHEFEILKNEIDISAEVFLSGDIAIDDIVKRKTNLNRIKMINSLAQGEKDAVKNLKDKKFIDNLNSKYKPIIAYFDSELESISKSLNESKKIDIENRFLKFSREVSSITKLIDKLIFNGKFFNFIKITGDKSMAENGIFGNLFITDYNIDDRFWNLK